MCENQIEQGSGGKVEVKPPDKWELRATIKSPVKGEYPKGKIKILIAETKGEGGRTVFEYTKFGNSGEEPTAYLLSGKKKSTYYLTAKSESPDESMWRSRETVKVELEAIEPVKKEVILSPPYAKVQFIAYDIATGEYRGLDDPSAADYQAKVKEDMKNRCAIMKKAIEEAYGVVKNNDPETLKIFMAPEFYFRGKAGAYPIEALSDLMEEMRLETNKMGPIEGDEATDKHNDYRDWLFVFGTALGYLKHNKDTAIFKAKVVSSDTESRADLEDKKHRNDLKDKFIGAYHLVGGKAEFIAGTVCKIKSVHVEPPNPAATDKKYTHELTLEGLKKAFPCDSDCRGLALSSDGNKPQEHVAKLKWKSSSVKVTHTSPEIIKPGWYLKHGDSQGRVTKVVKRNGSDYDLLVKGTIFSAGDVQAVDSGDTEIFNIAMVQKGGQDTSQLTDSPKEFREVLVYKENISSIDFYAPDLTAREDFYKDDAGLIQIGGEEIRRALPTEGHKGGSEINKSGIGGGSVFTIDDITFGLEVCLDHGESRLKSYYKGKKAPKGELLPQVQLIPSCGMSIQNPIEGGKVLIFNVDAQQCAVQKEGGKAIKNTSITAVSSVPAGLTFKDYFNEDQRLWPDDPGGKKASVKSEMGYIVVYPPLKLPQKDQVK